eukprot:697418-Karenia_brevis.AAC.1
MQTSHGEQWHKDLRLLAVKDVEEHPEEYSSFFIEGSMRRWASLMRQRAWGDNAALRAVSNVTKRPVVLWRRGSQKTPTCLFPRTFKSSERLQRLYMLFDETHRGAEHYTPLMLTAAEPPAPSLLEPDVPIDNEDNDEGADSDIQSAADGDEGSEDLGDNVKQESVRKRPAGKFTKVIKDTKQGRKGVYSYEDLLLMWQSFPTEP